MSYEGQLMEVLRQRKQVEQRLVDEAFARETIFGGDLATNLIELSALAEGEVLEALAEATGLPAQEPGELDFENDESYLLHQAGIGAVVQARPSGKVLVVYRQLSDAEQKRVAELLGSFHLSVGLRSQILRAHDQLVPPRSISKAPAPAPISEAPAPEQAANISEAPAPAEQSLTASSPAQTETLINEASSAGAEAPFSEAPSAGAEAPFSEAPISREVAPSAKLNINPWADHAATAPPPDGYDPIERSRPEDESPASSRSPYALPAISQAEVQQQLKEAADRDAIIQIVLRYAAGHFRYAALFAIGSKELKGLSAVGGEEADLSKIRFALDLKSSIQKVAESGDYRVVRLKSSGLEGGLYRDLNRPLGNSLFLWPIRVRSRPVLLLWGDQGDQDVEISSVGEISLLEPAIAEALERVLIKRKRASMMAQPSQLPRPDWNETAQKMRLTSQGQSAPSPLLAQAKETDHLLERDTRPRRPSQTPPDEAPAPALDAPAPPDDAPPSANAAPEAPAADAAAPEAPAADTAAPHQPTAPSSKTELPSTKVEGRGQQATAARGSYTPASQDAAPGSQVSREQIVSGGEKSRRTGTLPGVAIPSQPPALPEVDEPDSSSRPLAKIELKRRAPSGTQLQIAIEHVAPQGKNHPSSEEPAAFQGQIAPAQAGPNFGTKPPRTLQGFPLNPAERAKSPPDAAAAAEPAPADASAKIEIEKHKAEVPPAKGGESGRRPLMSRRIVPLDIAATRPRVESKQASEAPAPEAPIPEIVTNAPFDPKGTLVSKFSNAALPPDDGWESPAPPKKLAQVKVERPDYDQLIDALIAGEPHALNKLKDGGESAVGALMMRFPGPITQLAALDEKLEDAGPLFHALIEMGARAVPFITVRTADESAEIRRFATLLLGRLPSQESAKAIVRRLHDSDAEVRRAALLSARLLMQDTLARRALAAALDQIARDSKQSEDERKVAVHTLALLGEAHCVPTLLQLLEDSALSSTSQAALLQLTGRDLGSNLPAWQRFWQANRNRPRAQWLADALLSESEHEREAAFTAIAPLLPSTFGYTPNQPAAERAQAVEQMRAAL